MKQLKKSYPQVVKFIDEVIIKESKVNLSDKNFTEIVEYANSIGYKLSDIELLNSLNTYLEANVTLPAWLNKRLAGLAIWAAWDD